MLPRASCITSPALLRTRTPLLTGTDVAAKREEIRAYFHNTFSLYDRLFDVLASDETFFMQPEQLRHPLIFYFGHTAVFFVNKLRLAGLLRRRIDERLESSLAIGVDEMSWDDTSAGNYVWPTVDEVRRYRDTCRQLVDGIITDLPLTLPITWDQPFWAILMGCEHERIHLETSSVLFRQLPVEQVRAMPMWAHCTDFRSRASEVPTNELLLVPGGEVKAGKSHETADTYGWDNEYGTLTSQVDCFRAAKYLTSNAEFLAFVEDGGYDDPTLWGDEGWRFVQFRRASCPVFWVPVDEDGEPITNETARRRPAAYRYRALTAVIDMPWDWPVDCNYIEAKAFCAWKNRARDQQQKQGEGDATDDTTIRLPTEAEYLRLREHAYPASVADKSGAVTLNDQPHWPVAPGNLNLEHFASSCPIDRFAFAHSFHDIVGNAWQWTETAIAPLRGFRPHPLYSDFSVPTFDTRHNLFMGGSWISTGNEATRHARYAFRRHFYQHAGFRYVEARPIRAGPTDRPQAMCETDPTVARMMDAQFNDRQSARFGTGADKENYAVRIAKLAARVYQEHGRTGTPRSNAPPTSPSTNTDATITSLNSAGPRALDIGCACGRTTFELAKLSASVATPNEAPLFSHILGLDFSALFIRVAAQLQFDRHAEYEMKKEGELLSFHAIEGVSAEKADELANAAASVAVETDSAAPSFVDLDLASRGMLDRVQFLQGDACNLDAKYTGFDLVVASNLLDHLYEPRLFLDTIGARMRRGGILVLADTFTWREEVTPREHWLGGVRDAGGETVDSSRVVSELLARDFDALPQCTTDLPMVWKEDARNFQFKIAQVTVWRKR